MKHPERQVPLTEQDIRLLLKKDGSIRSLDIPQGTVVTPSALEILKMNSIDLHFTDAEEKPAEAACPAAYTGPGGEKLDSKPEEMTHLYGNQLTKKDNPVIAFRGKLDKLCAMILEAQVLGAKKENRAFVNDMQEILEFVRSLLPAEYKDISLGDFRILGLSSRELRERSHHPEKYFGRGHLLMHYSMGELCLRLNLLRTITRETELAAVAALYGSDTADSSKCRHKDIVEALNRLSSLFYILIFKYLPRDYSPVGKAGI